jgi:hypothetical protein
MIVHQPRCAAALALLSMLLAHDQVPAQVPLPAPSSRGDRAGELDDIRGQLPVAPSLAAEPDQPGLPRLKPRGHQIVRPGLSKRSDRG